ncbi:MAG: hypothetical protein LBV14_13330 [Acidovorax sp.]|jgi:hypothetical protein|nr:hypothetical protein [Acidovorax sp.]
MRVRAIQTGFYGCLRVPGTDSEEFDVPDGEKATWFAPVEQPGDGQAANAGGGRGRTKAEPAAGQPVEQPGDGRV